MNILTEKKALRLVVAFLLTFGSTATLSYAQPVYSKPSAPPATKPLLQPIVVQPDGGKSGNSEMPLVKKTGVATPVVPAVSSVKSSFPILRETAIPGYSGVLVETLDGSIVVENSS